MCGIAGFFQTQGSTANRTILKGMTDAIKHRGPDDEGFYEHQTGGNGRVHLGHRRLSIVDLALGHQPIGNEENNVWIVYNGEIFNHADLRPELERRGHRYRTHSDTETLLHAWEEWGPACLEHFRGMFSFAIWDEKKATLFAARDRFGIKPFYYYWDGSVFAFASEIKALFVYPGLEKAMEEGLLAEYLSFGYVGGDRTMFRNVRKLMPGHHLMLREQNGKWELAIERYWDVPEVGPEEGSEQEWLQRVEAGLEETVRMRLMADVPLGTFLSGGVDSSLITALVCRMTKGRVKSFSVGYREAAFSELGFAAEVSAKLGTEHREVVIGCEEFFGSLRKLIWHEDEPIAWPSSVPLYHISKRAAQEVKVVLTGEGADELFGGYERYRWNMLNRRAGSVYGLLPAGLRRGVRSFIGGTDLLGGDLRRKLKHTFLGRDLTMESMFLDNFYGAFNSSEQERLFGHAIKGIHDSYLSYWKQRKGGELDRMLYADQKTYLVELLMKQDQMSMAASIESRVPFLDHQFASLAMRVPSGLKIRGNVQKYIVKRVAEKYLPKEIVYRKKMGFPTPLRQWFREAQTTDILNHLTNKHSFIGDYLNTQVVDDLLQRHRAGAEDGTDRLWRLLNLELWGQNQFQGRSVES